MSLWDICVDGEWDLTLVRAALDKGDVDVNKRSLHNREMRQPVQNNLLGVHEKWRALTQIIGGRSSVKRR